MSKPQYYNGFTGEQNKILNQESFVDKSLGCQVPSSQSVSDHRDDLGDEVGDEGREKVVRGEEVSEAEDEDLEDGERELVTIEQNRVI